VYVIVSNEQEWHRFSGQSKLAPDGIHVWRAYLDRSDATVQHFQHVLSPEERERAQRFHFEKDRRQWMIARGQLRCLLAAYLQVAPSLLRFRLNAYGKPLLDVPFDATGLAFNLSHSASLALYAFAPTPAVGVDVEYMRPDIDIPALARISFSSNERAALFQLAAGEQLYAFYTCWTRKEAYIKARGMGLSLPLEQFDVELRPGKPAALLQSREEEPQDVSDWSMYALFPGENYAGALAVKGKGWNVQCWQSEM
jgi:4'-phosphopantetheinyl transferase